MEKLSKHDLITNCEKLQSKLQRYEIRFAALVDAYKNLTEEKNVLESTLKTLSAKPSPKKSLFNKASITASNSSDPLGVNSDPLNSQVINCTEDNAAQDIHFMEEKIVALSSALQSVTEAKAKMEASFQADKKLTLAEHTNRLSEVGLETQKAYDLANELKVKLRTEQQERENEQKNHSSMLKELQVLLNAERLEKDELRIQLNEISTVMKKASQKQISDYEEKIEKLTAELKKLQSKEEDVERNTSQNILDDLTKQMELIKKERLEDLLAEKQRANKAEDMLKLRQQCDERRIAELELRLSELSETVGNYDQLRYQDQQMIRQLKERLENLNEDLPRQPCVEENKVSDLEDQIAKLKSLLKLSCAKTQTDIQRLSDVEGFVKDDVRHLLCQAEYKQLKDDFELYKRRHAHTSKDKNDEPSLEVIEYKKKIEKLEKSLKNLELKNSQEEREHLRIISTLQVEFTKLEDDYNQKTEQLKIDNIKNVEKIEIELKKQRDRTLDLLAEKDLEIEKLRVRQYENEYLLRQTPRSQEVFKFPDITEKSAIDEILENSPAISPTKKEKMFHYTQLLEQQSMELSSNRAQLEDVKSALRDSERREDQLVQQMHLLKEEIRSLERNRSRESANLEYLKNICLQYMLSECPSKRKQMARAIATILYFSPTEIATIEKHHKNGW